jgi:preprotein translocase subunit SecD
VETKLGLDLQGGLRVEYQALPADGQVPTAQDMADIRTIIERRVNASGVSEPLVVTQGVDRVVVELPGIDNPETVRALVGHPAWLAGDPERPAARPRGVSAPLRG